LCSEHTEALQRNPTEEPVGSLPLVGNPQLFHDDGNRSPDLLLKFRYKPASMGHKVRRADERMHTLLSKTREVPKYGLINLPIEMLQ
jgi:hypothetical protein